MKDSCTHFDDERNRVILRIPRKENERVRHVHPAPQAMSPSTPPARMASGAGIFQGGETTACPLSSATGLVQNRGTPKCVA